MFLLRNSFLISCGLQSGTLLKNKPDFLGKTNKVFPKILILQKKAAVATSSIR